MCSGRGTCCASRRWTTSSSNSDHDPRTERGTTGGMSRRRPPSASAEGHRADSATRVPVRTQSIGSSCRPATRCRRGQVPDLRRRLRDGASGSGAVCGPGLRRPLQAARPQAPGEARAAVAAAVARAGAAALSVREPAAGGCAAAVAAAAVVLPLLPRGGGRLRALCAGASSAIPAARRWPAPQPGTLTDPDAGGPGGGGVAAGRDGRAAAGRGAAFPSCLSGLRPRDGSSWSAARNRGPSAP